MRGKRILDLTEETSLTDDDAIPLDRDTYSEARHIKMSALRTYLGIDCLITDAALISTITDESNWVDGQYTGSTTGLDECNYYIDTTYRIKYEFDGTTLIRYSINNII